MQKLKRLAGLALIAGAVLVLDQGAKWLVVNNLALGESWDALPAIAGFIRVTRSFNTGAAFGMFPLASNLILALAIVTVIAFIAIYLSLPKTAWLSRISIALIAGGALSNAIDRLRFGHVVDYVHVQLTPTFANVSNFADHAITVGVVLLLIDQWLMERETRREEDEAPGLPAEPAEMFEEPEAPSAEAPTTSPPEREPHTSG